MKLVDIMPVEDWIDMENEFIEMTGLCAGVLDAENKRVTTNVKWSNKVCPRIKGDPKGLAQICSVAQGGMAAKARETGKPVIQECDAGMLKIVVPIFANGEYLGTAGGCGLLAEDGELETFFISKALEIPESEIPDAPVGTLNRSKAEEAADWLDKRLKEAVKG